MNILYKVYQANICFGLYGFTRGFRSETKEQNDILFIQRTVNGFCNSLFYIAPGINLYNACNLIGRLEVKIRNLPPSSYQSLYTEATGTCYSTM